MFENKNDEGKNAMAIRVDELLSSMVRTDYSIVVVVWYLEAIWETDCKKNRQNFEKKM